MSGLNQARDSLKAELAHAMQGIDYYQRRIQALEKALGELEQIDDLESGAQQPAKGRRGRAARADKRATPAKRGGARRGRVAKSGTASAGGELPATGGSFWTELVGSEPQTAPQILEAASRKIGTDLSPALRKKLAQRMVMALRGLVKNGAIKDTGQGRQRQYFHG